MILAKKYVHKTRISRNRPKLRRAVLDAIERNTCTECRKCCNSVAFKGDVPEPVRLKIAELRLESRIDRSETGFTIIDGDGEDCSFLDSKGCGIYDHRPRICRIYPLEVIGIEKARIEFSRDIWALQEDRSLGIVCLDSTCPIGRDLLAQGISFLYLDEIIGIPLFDVGIEGMKTFIDDHLEPVTRIRFAETIDGRIVIPING